MSTRRLSKKTKLLLYQGLILIAVLGIIIFTAIWFKHQRQTTARNAMQAEQANNQKQQDELNKEQKDASDLKLIQACQDEVIARKAEFLVNSQSFSAAEIQYAENTFDQQYKQCDNEPIVNPLGL